MRIIKIDRWSEHGTVQGNVTCVEVHVGNKNTWVAVCTNNNKIWKLEGISDEHSASNKETHISVTGYVIYFMGIPITWQSHGQKGVVISTTNVECVVYQRL